MSESPESHNFSDEEIRLHKRLRLKNIFESAERTSASYGIPEGEFVEGLSVEIKDKNGKTTIITYNPN